MAEFFENKKSEQIDCQEKNPISLRYTMFADKLLKMLNELTRDRAEFYIAVLSAGGSEEFCADLKSRINFEEIHILSEASSFKNTKFDIKQERYIIKDRILETWNNDRCDLQSKGYHIELHNRNNKKIYRRTHDSLDYGDGHMSLFTIRQFVLGIRNLNNTNNSGKDNCDTKFKYIKLSDVEQIMQNHNAQLNENTVKYKYWFLTQLPIFMEDTDNEYNNLDQ